MKTRALAMSLLFALAATPALAQTSPPANAAAPGLLRIDVDARDLARRIAHAFSLSEMEELAADVFETDPEGILTGETLERRASSLVLAAARRDVSSRLVALCREKRPGGGF